MASYYTIVKARNEEHLQLLKGILSSTFKEAVKIVPLPGGGFGKGSSTALAVKSLDPARRGKLGKSAFTWKQRRSLQKLGYQLQNGASFGSFKK